MNKQYPTTAGMDRVYAPAPRNSVWDNFRKMHPNTIVRVHLFPGRQIRHQQNWQQRVRRELAETECVSYQIFHFPTQTDPDNPRVKIQGQDVVTVTIAKRLVTGLTAHPSVLYSFEPCPLDEDGICDLCSTTTEADDVELSKHARKNKIRREKRREKKKKGNK